MHLLRRQYHAVPVIQPNSGHKKRLAEWDMLPDSVDRDALYRKRTSVERVFSRLKGQRALNYLTVRRRWKVTAHCYLSLIALQVAHLAIDPGA